MKTLSIKTFFLLMTALVMGSAFAQGPGSALVIINGTKITSAQLEQWVSIATSEGAKDSPELRQGILNDLVIREAIEQDIKKTNLLSKGNNAFKVKLATQNAAMELWFAQYFAAHPISEADIKAEYDKQVALSKEPKNAKEYQLSQIVVPSEVDGNQILSQLQAGSSFQALAKEKSLDKVSSQNGGLVGWALPGQLAPPMNDVVLTLSKGGVVSKPIQVGNVWYVVKVDDVKPFVMPTFDQAKTGITQAMIQKERQSAIQSLLKDAKISKGK
jgi:peptidyl-prolyl cis-trans isomerase C